MMSIRGDLELGTWCVGVVHEKGRAMLWGAVRQMS